MSLSVSEYTRKYIAFTNTFMTELKVSISVFKQTLNCTIDKALTHEPLSRQLEAAQTAVG